jgi:hypothetical protein
MMKTLQFFSRRPSASGLQLLTDPFPERLNARTSLFEQAGNLSAQREFISTSGRLRMTTAEKK